MSRSEQKQDTNSALNGFRQHNDIRNEMAASTAPGRVPPMMERVSGNTVEFGMSALRPATRYTVRVYAVSGSLQSAVSTTEFTTAVDAPRDLSASNVQTESAVLTWKAPRASITGYILIFTSADGKVKEVVLGPSTTSYNLAQLSASTQYTVRLQALAGPERSKIVRTQFTTTGLLYRHPRDCSQALLNGETSSGLYTIYLKGEESQPVQVIVRRQNGKLQFYRNWKNYTAGFGDMNDEFWLGLDSLHKITSSGQYELRVDLRDRGESAYAQYDKFTISDPRSRYKINVGGYSGTAVPPMMERVSGNTVEFGMSALRPATRYTVRVYAVSGSLQSAVSTTEFTTAVDAPRDLSASNVQTESAVLTWKAPRASITGYILIFTSADGKVKEVVLGPSTTSYNLAQLSASTQYTVRLQALAGPERSKIVRTQFTTTGLLYRHPRDCSQALLNGETSSGLYTIYLKGEESQPVQVYCDMATDGGGWIVIVRRQNGKLQFYRNWKNYTAGFGDMNDEFWLGLDSLHKITSSGQYELRVDLRDRGESAYAQYDKFTISDPRSRYKINVGGYSGTAGDSMSYHQGRPFSTYDKDNDIAVTNCALSYKGAFWYKNCHRVNLMGRYGDDNHSQVSTTQPEKHAAGGFL
ncbi:Tenascin [Acipenser ruthenus]|uniref:Tenascin n=1 Tax=Acipenser ruthenus TaxID=7906 RepID=A0A444UW05_ACIRT|nr:Tenascin [Acipenser ruthenus]